MARFARLTTWSFTLGATMRAARATPTSPCRSFFNESGRIRDPWNDLAC